MTRLEMVLDRIRTLTWEMVFGCVEDDVALPIMEALVAERDALMAVAYV